MSFSREGRGRHDLTFETEPPVSKLRRLDPSATGIVYFHVLAGHVTFGFIVL